jgi:hypothetical protein
VADISTSNGFIPGSGSAASGVVGAHGESDTRYPPGSASSVTACLLDGQTKNIAVSYAVQNHRSLGKLSLNGDESIQMKSAPTTGNGATRTVTRFDDTFNASTRRTLNISRREHALSSHTSAPLNPRFGKHSCADVP